MNAEPALQTDTAFRSQFGEDRILSDFFRGKKDGVFLEVGAYDGVTLSNTYYFETLGWSGVLVEAVPKLAAQCIQSRPRSTVVNCAVVAPSARGQVSFEHWTGAEGHSTLDGAGHVPKALRGSDVGIENIVVEGRTVDDVLEECNITRLDFVTIDVEGHEWGVLQGFDLGRWRPEIVIVESAGYSPDRTIVQHMVAHGYGFLRTTGVNTWYCRKDSSRVAPWQIRWTRFAYPAALTSYLVTRGRPRVTALARRLLGWNR